MSYDRNNKKNYIQSPEISVEIKNLLSKTIFDYNLFYDIGPNSNIIFVSHIENIGHFIDYIEIHIRKLDIEAFSLHSNRLIFKCSKGF